MLTLYLLFARYNAFLWRAILQRRLKQGKEDPARYQEKLGHNLAERPEGEIIWIHGVSVGESLSLLTLLKQLGEALPDTHFVLTTNTRTSSDTLARMGLPPRVIHQFQPCDNAPAMRRFLAHWQPSVAVFSELDMWPCLLSETDDAGITMLLINARMSDRSLNKRRHFKGVYRSMVQKFAAILTQEDVSRDNFIRMGANPATTQTTGPLKIASAPLPDLPDQREQLVLAIGARPHWLAASTHPEEEARILQAHAIARETLSELLLILAPRHPKFADDTLEIARPLFDHIAQRSKGEPITNDTEVYLADTLGELGLFFRLAHTAFIGHSLETDGAPLPGKNPYEALVLDTLVMHGPDYADFTHIYDELKSAGATHQIRTAEELAQAVIAAQDLNWREPYITAGKSAVSKGEEALALPLQAILDARGI
ncbi:3-deoxy-D-manno-octulosonic acid transferase [Falsihalocynthiibacter sp. SS001]|uniref:3-deoxy-D-manno-octulosonic acid transferase n=1 Tax=Falsihalocynthiibacter sp. SS001 TaxID=3349698 RepID=UPI0036D22192